MASDFLNIFFLIFCLTWERVDDCSTIHKSLIFNELRGAAPPAARKCQEKNSFFFRKNPRPFGRGFVCGYVYAPTTTSVSISSPASAGSISASIVGRCPAMRSKTDWAVIVRKGNLDRSPPLRFSVMEL